MHSQLGHSIWAAELAGLVDIHPATNLFIQKGELNTLMSELQALLPPDELAAALKRGKTLDLEATVRDLLDQTEIGRALGLHWTRIHQIVKSKN